MRRREALRRRKRKAKPGWCSQGEDGCQPIFASFAFRKLGFLAGGVRCLRRVTPGLSPVLP